MKKSGLADSPFFRPSPLSKPILAESTPVKTLEPIPAQIDTQPHERTDAQLHESTSAQLHNHTDTQLRNRTDTQPHTYTDAHMNGGTDAQSRNRTSTQSHERTLAQLERLRTRESYDIFEDQAQTIEELRLKWSKTRKKHITKGQVMRELLDEILPKHQ
jgi:hypothetical protein